MNKFLLSIVAVALLSTAAEGANHDSYDWSGFYLGAAAGLVDGKTKE